MVLKFKHRFYITVYNLLYIFVAMYINIYKYKISNTLVAANLEIYICCCLSKFWNTLINTCMFSISNLVAAYLLPGSGIPTLRGFFFLCTAWLRFMRLSSATIIFVLWKLWNFSSGFTPGTLDWFFFCWSTSEHGMIAGWSELESKSFTFWFLEKSVLVSWFDSEIIRT